MKQLTLILSAFSVALLGTFALIPVASVSALDPLGDICADNPSSEVCQSSTDDAGNLIQTLVSVLLFVVGALSVIMIIFAGILYVTSTGDSGKIARAKNTLIYAVVGLLVSFFAYAIIFWVLRLFPA